MASRIIDLAALMCVVCLGASQWMQDDALAPPRAAASAVTKPAAQFPPSPIDHVDRTLTAESRRAPALAGDADAAIARISQWATLDLDSLRRAFANSNDLYAFVQRRIAM